MKEKNIIVIIPYLSSGGAERAAISLANKLDKDYNVKIVVYDASMNQYDYNQNIKLIDMKIKESKNKIKKIINFINKIKKLKKIKRKYNIEYSISFLRQPNLLNVLTKQKNEKTIISIRNRMEKDDNTFWKRFITKFSSNKADTVVALSKMVQKEQIELYGIDKNKVKVIYNDCNLNRINSMKNETINDKNCKEIIENSSGKIVMNIGRLTYQKGQWHLIRAFKEVVNKIPDAKLLILGQGELEKDLKELIKIQGLQDNVFLLGFHRNPYKFLSKSNIFVFSSQFEGLGNILLEAMACGKPIISTDCMYGPREIISPSSNLNKQCDEMEVDEYGILVPVCEDKFLTNEPITAKELIMSKAIISLLTNERLKDNLIEKSIERIKYFNPESNFKKWKIILEENENV